MKIFLDDLRRLNHVHPSEKLRDWKIARNVSQFEQLVEKYWTEIETISFDHDLGESDERMNGMYCAHTIGDMICMVENDGLMSEVKLRNIFIHTANPAGRANLVSYFECLAKNFGIPLTIKVIYNV